MVRSGMLGQWRTCSGWARQAVGRVFKRSRVRVSFDIDDTLACKPLFCEAAEQSRVPLFIHRWLGEPLRGGTRELMRNLRRQGCSIWIYTSSGRTPGYIRRWLLLYGIRVDGVVNSDRHHAVAVKGLANAPSKFPPAFDIDLHVDDSEGVGLEGDDHGFRVVVVCPQDENWAQKVLAAAEDVQAQVQWQQRVRHKAPVHSPAEAMTS